MADLFALPFLRRAALAGMLVGFLASFYGVFVVQRGLSFLGSGLAHAAFGGVALGLLLHTEPLAVAVPFTVLVAIGITWVRQRTALGSDTVIGVFTSVAMALGVVFLSLRRAYTGDAFNYLFGSILAVHATDLWVTAALVTVALATWPLWSRWAYATFDRDLALADRLPVDRDDQLLGVFIAVTVVVAVKIVGIVLVAAFLVVPAAAARLVTRTFWTMTLVSVGFGIASALVGLWASYGLDVPSGATIILVQGALFGVAMLAGRRTSARR